METTQVEQAIVLLQNTQKQVYELLEPFSGLYLQADHLLTVLINGLIFTTQQTDLTNGQSNFNPTPLFFSEEPKKLTIPITTSINGIDAVPEEVDKLRQKAIELYNNFTKRENKDILEACNALEIRAVAKLAGIDPINHPEQIDHVFIQSIKEAITGKDTEQKAMEEWLAKQEKEEKQLAITQEPEKATKQSKTGQASKKINTKK